MPQDPNDADLDAGDDWPDDLDAQDEADRVYREKWAAHDAPDAPLADYVPGRATPKAVHDSYRDGMTAAGPYLGLGAQIGGSMALFCGLGYVVDRWLGTSPWGILVGAMLGMAGIVALLVRLAREADRKKR